VRALPAGKLQYLNGKVDKASADNYKARVRAARAARQRTRRAR
jgi:hypothetical protein